MACAIIRSCKNKSRLVKNAHEMYISDTQKKGLKPKFIPPSMNLRLIPRITRAPRRLFKLTI